MYELPYTGHCQYVDDWNCDPWTWECTDNVPSLVGPIAIERGNTYEMRMHWANTVYPSGPDYDWTCNVYLCDADCTNQIPLVEYHPNDPGYEDDEWLPASPIEGVFVHDPDELMGKRWTNAPSDPTINKTAYLQAYIGDLKIYRPKNPPIQVQFVPDEFEFVSDDPSIFPGAGIRYNGDDDDEDGIVDNWDGSVTGEDDLIRIRITGPDIISPNIELVLHKNSPDIKVWDTEEKETELVFDSEGNATIIVDNERGGYYVECISPNLSETTLQLGIRETGNDTFSELDKVLIQRFQSVVIALGGWNQEPTDPVSEPNNHGTFLHAIDLYHKGHHVYMMPEHFVNGVNGGDAFVRVHESVFSLRTPNVAVLGYSWGGGATYDFCEYWSNMGYDKIAFSSYVDAVMSDSPYPEGRRPDSIYHLNQFQTPDLLDLLYGVPIPNSHPLPSGRNVEYFSWGLLTTHTAIDDLSQVADLIDSALNSQIPR